MKIVQIFFRDQARIRNTTITIVKSRHRIAIVILQRILELSPEDALRLIEA